MSTQTKFAKLITPILEWETGGDMVNGGWNHDPGDLGGPTQWGLASNYQAPDIADKIRRKVLTRAEAERVYYTNYYLPSKADQYPDPIAFVLFDHTIHGTLPRVAEGWQAFLNKFHAPLEVDGVVGKDTRSALLTLPKKLWVTFLAVDYACYISNLKNTIAHIKNEQKQANLEVTSYRRNFTERAGRRLKLARSFML